MNAPEAVAILYEAIHPFGTAYVAGDVFTPKDIAKAQNAVFEVSRAVKLGEVALNKEWSTGGMLDQANVTTVLYHVATQFGHGPYPGDVITARQTSLAIETVAFFKRATAEENKHHIRVRKAARA